MATQDTGNTVGVYDNKRQNAPLNTANVDVRPTDLVRWGPVLAGLFAALATLVTLSVLGLAVGLSAYDPNAPLSAFGIGAGIWGAITALISFLIGGWLAGRSAAFSGNTSGVLNGAMVWFVAVPLLIYMLGAGLGSLAGTAGAVAGTAAEVAGSAAANPAVQATAGAVAGDPAAQATAQGAVEGVQATAQAAIDSVTPQDFENAANTAGSTAWGILLSLGLAAGASTLGGFLGGRARDTTTVSTVQRR
jgi:hypothetical protein